MQPLFRAYAGPWDFRGARRGGSTVLCALGLLLLGSSPAQAFGRLQRVLTDLPGESGAAGADGKALARRPLHTRRIQVSGGSLWFLQKNFFNSQLYEMPLATATVIHRAGSTSSFPSRGATTALDTQLVSIEDFCVLRDRSVLFATGPGRPPALLRIDPGTDGAFGAETRFGDPFVQRLKMDSKVFEGRSAPVARADGKVSLLDAPRQRFLHFAGDEVHIQAVPAVEGKEDPFYLAKQPLEAKDGSLLFLQSFGNVFRLWKVDAESKVTLLAANLPGNSKEVPGVLPIDSIQGVGSAPDGSLLIASKPFLGPGALYRLRGQETTLVLGPFDRSKSIWQAPVLADKIPLDPNYLADAVFEPNEGNLAVLDDGSILFAQHNGIFLLAPKDELQEVLEGLYRVGADAVKEGRKDLVAEVERLLSSLAAIKDFLPAGEELKEGKTVLPSTVTAIVQGYLQGQPCLQFRARLALQALTEFAQAASGAAPAGAGETKSDGPGTEGKGIASSDH